jgi:hypothetical protein
MRPPPGQEETVQPLEVYFDGHAYLSMWLPTPEELAALNEGKAVAITLFGVHPPIYLVDRSNVN